MVGGRAGVALVIVLVCASWAQAVPGAPRADWLQYGGDAANTGAGVVGPDLPEIAWRAQLPVGRAYFAAPLIVDRYVYVLGSGPPGADPTSDDGVYRLALDSGSVEPWVAIEQPANAFASDGALIIVTTNEDVRAYGLEDRSSAWTAAHPVLSPDQTRTACPFLKVHEGVAYTACTAQSAQVGNPGYGESGEVTSALFVRALDATTGEVLWTWIKDVVGQTGTEGAPSADILAPTSAPFVTYLNGLAVIGPYVFVTGIDGLGEGGMAEVYAWALDAATGSVLWRRGSNEAQGVDCGTNCVFKNAAEPTGTPSIVFLKLDTLVAVNPARNTVLWEQDLSGQDTQSSDPGAGLALGEASLFAASRETLYQFQADAQGTGRNWEPLDPSEGHVWTTQHLHLAAGSLYGRSRGASDTTQHAIRAYDIETGEPQWQVPLVHEGKGFADLQFLTSLGPAVIVAAGIDGSVHVVGRTAVSLVPRATASDVFPAPGTEVRIAVEADGTGVGGPPSAWRVDWGDGFVDDWTDAESLNHRYETVGPVRALVQVRNDAGQVGATFITFDVGGTAPPPPGLVDWYLENQDLAWGVLGLVTAAAGAILALWRRAARRRLMRSELGRVKHAFAAAGADPAAGHAAHRSCRARVDDLLLRGRIDETQATLLGRQIDEHARAAQARTLDERLAFLPHAFVLRLRRALADGAMDAAERAALLAELDRGSLPAGERKLARAFVEAWHGAAGDPAPTTP